MNEFLRETWNFARGTFARNAAKVGGGAAVGQLLALGASPLLTRLYTPEEFGVLIVFASIVATLFAVLAGRYETAIPLPENDRDAASVVFVGSVIVVLIVLVSAVVILLVGSTRITTWTNTPQLKPYLWLIPFALLGAGAYKVLNYWVIRRNAYPIVARSKITQNASRVGSQLGLGFFEFGSIGLLIGEVLGRMGGMSSLATYTFRNDWALFSSVRLRRMWKVALRYRRFLFLAAPSSLLNKAALQLPALLFASIYSPQIAGWFGLAQRVISVPVWLISEAVHQVYLGEISELAQNSPAKLKKTFYKVTGILAVAGILPALALWMLGDTVFPFVFGESWTESGRYAELMAVAFAGQIVVSPISVTLNVLERQDLQLIWDSARFAAIVAILMVGSALEVSARTTVGLFSVGLGVAYIALWGMCLYTIRARLRDSRRSIKTVD